MRVTPLPEAHRGPTIDLAEIVFARNCKAQYAGQSSPSISIVQYRADDWIQVRVTGTVAAVQTSVLSVSKVRRARGISDPALTF